MNDTLGSVAKRRRVNSAEHQSLTEADPLDDELQDASAEGNQPPPVTRSANKVDTNSDSSTQCNNDQCCVCFRTYEEDQEEETGFLWVQCVCQRWIHEDCYSEVVMDKHGRELICPYCVM